MKVLGVRILLVLVISLFFVHYSTAQNYVYDAGTPVYTKTEPVEMGFINLANGNLHLEIPLTSSPQRSDRQFTAALVYDSRIWKPIGTWSPTNVLAADQTNPSWGGWRLITSADTGKASNSTVTDPCNPDPPFGGFSHLYHGFSWTSPDGVRHDFPNVETFDDPCGGASVPNSQGPANDSSGLYMYVANYVGKTVKDRHGRIVYGGGGFTDTNGNFFSGSVSAGNLKDTLGRTSIAVSGTNPVIYTIANSQGTTQQITVTLRTITVNTRFLKFGVADCNGCNITVIDNIQFPDGSIYRFDYDNGPAGGFGTYGLLTSMTLPTGGVITYGYTTFSDSYTSYNRWVSSRSKDGGQTTYTPAVITSCTSGQVDCQQKVTLRRPSNDEVEYVFTLNNGAWNSQVRAFNGLVSGNPLQTVNTTYDFANPCTPACPGAQYIRSTSVTTDVLSSNGTLHKKVQYAYDSPEKGNVVSIKEWNFTTGGFNTNPDRETAVIYSTNTNYTSRNMIDLPTSIVVKDGSGTCAPNSGVCSETLISYDSTAITAVAPNPSNHLTAFDNTFLFRGNPTSIRKWTGGTTYLETKLYYDATGQVIKVEDPKLNATLFGYGDNFYNDGSPATVFTPPVPTNAYLTQVTQPLIGVSTVGYYFSTGQMAFGTDTNGAQTENHYLDSLSRPTVAYGPSVTGGRFWVLNTYTGATQVDTYTTLNGATASTACASCRQDRVNIDTFGRLSQSKVVSDNHPNGPARADTAYDSSGRVATVSNPHRTGAEPTDGLETLAYDGLNRVTQATHPDGQVARTYFGDAVTGGGGRSVQKCSGVPGFPILTVDEAGKKRQTWTDGFGRIIEVDEPDSSGSVSNDATVLFTCYSYDAANNLLQTAQGPQTRTYTYDKLGRVSSGKIPESGNPQIATSYFYTTAAGSLCSGDPGSICRRVDPRGVTTTYTYDALNRLTLVDYSDTTADISYFYDQTTYNGLTITNGKGRRTGMSDGSGQTAWSYSAAGNPLTVRKTISGTGSITRNISYTYNLNGSVASITYPSGRVITYAYNNAFLPIWAVDSTNSINYVLNAQYAPHQALSSALLGNDHGNGGTTLTQSFNNRLLPVQFRAANSAGTIMDFSFDFAFPSGANNGTLERVLNNRDHTRDQTFTYDELNRVKTASAGTLWGNQFVYDRWGNLLQKIVTAGTGEPLTVTVNPNTNRIQDAGYVYDAAGNLTNDTFVTYTYSAENKVLSANNGTATTTFKYDGDGVRVFKSGYRIYWTGMGTEVLAETWPDGVNKREYIYFAGKRVALVDLSVSGGNCAGTPPNCARYYFYSDHLGSTNVLADASGGTTVAESDYFPFGGERVVISSSITPGYKFTGKEWDSQDSLNHFLFREYSPRLGRFMSPDLLAGTIGDPQSLNRYSYVVNNPINLVDPLGLRDEDRLAEIEQRLMAHIDLIDARNAAGGLSGGCSLNGMPASCAVVASLAGMGGYGTVGIFCSVCSIVTQWSVLDGHLMVDLGSIPEYRQDQAFVFSMDYITGTYRKDAKWMDVGVVGMVSSMMMGGEVFPIRGGTGYKRASASNEEVTIRAQRPITQDDINAACAIVALNENNGLGIPSGRPYGGDSVSSGVTIWHRTTIGDRPLNPRAVSGVAVMAPLAAPGIFLQASYRSCGGR